MLTTAPYRILLIEKESYGVNEELTIRNHTVTKIDNKAEALNHLQNIEHDQYDIILLDLDMPGYSSWELLKKVKLNNKFKNCPLIILSKLDDESTEIQALNNGGDDYLVKPCSSKLLIARIEANIRMKTSLLAISNITLNKQNYNSKLTKRESEILKYIVKGYTNKQIAERAYITTLTAANHIKRIFKKLNVNSRTQAVLVALKNNLITTSI
ncbi:MAG: DNA-binding response regulator [Cyanobacteriota bacterium]